MKEVAEVYRQAGVAAIYLVHGTFVGPDAAGMLAELGRVFPTAGRAIRRLVARVMHKLTGEVGNFTPQYAELFESALRGSGDPSEQDDTASAIPVRLFQWSSENNHIGRADGAVRLIDELASLELPPGSRVLLWGHSHAGNLFALMTHLLAGNREAAREFFRATEVYFRWPLLQCVDIPVWHRVRRLLCNGGLQRLANLSLDIATFGTPIRYGWNADGYSQLLHFIYHRPAPGLPHYRAAFPPKLQDMLRGAEGDYVQQLGIAGTDISPSLFAWRAWLANRRLGRLFLDQSPYGGPLERFKAGAIVPDEGTTLLVDYGIPQGGIARHHAGHALYTYHKWLLFHAEEVAKRFYSAD
jgi:hypothetical protein